MVGTHQQSSPGVQARKVSVWLEAEQELKEQSGQLGMF